MARPRKQAAEATIDPDLLVPVHPRMMDALTGDYTTTLADLERRVIELREALRPFAAHGKRLRAGNRRGAARQQVYDCGIGDIGSVLTMGDFDRAMAAIGGDDGRG